MGEFSFNAYPFGRVRCAGLLSVRSGWLIYYRALTLLWFLVVFLFLFVVLFVPLSLCVLFWGSSKSIPCSRLFLWFLASSLFLCVSLCCCLEFSFSLCSPGALLNRYRALSFSFGSLCSLCFSLCSLLCPLQTDTVLSPFFLSLLFSLSLSLSLFIICVPLRFPCFFSVVFPLGPALKGTVVF